MEILFDKAINTKKPDGRIKIFFKDFYSTEYNDIIYHLLIDNKVVGIVHLEKKYSCFQKIKFKCNIYCLEILTPYRNKKYGKILLREIEKWCFKNNISTMTLNVSNPIAFKLYDKYGFEILDEDYDEEEEVFYFKMLKEVST